MSLMQEFDKLGQKQLATQDAVKLLEQIRKDLLKSKASAEFWGKIAMFCNAILIPLNAIINFFPVTVPKSIYQRLAHALHDKFASGRSGLDGTIKAILGELKEAIVGELKRKGLTHFIPGLNILVGLVEDSLALMKVALSYKKGDSNMTVAIAKLDKNLGAQINELRKLGLRRNEILGRVQTISRTV